MLGGGPTEVNAAKQRRKAEQRPGRWPATALGASYERRRLPLSSEASEVEQPADALAAVDREDRLGEQAGDADDLAAGGQGLEPVADRVGQDQLLDRAPGDLGGRPLGEDAVRDAGVDVLAPRAPCRRWPSR